MAGDRPHGSRTHSPSAGGEAGTGSRARLLAVGLLAATVLAHAQAARHTPSRPASRPSRVVSVSIAGGPVAAAVPPGFLGLSFELSSLGQVAGFAARGDFVTMLRSLGTGVLRFGGVSADTRVAWVEEGETPPAWATATVTPADLRRLAALASASGWRVLLTIGLGHYEPAAAAREAIAARAALGGSLEAIEIGNEPNAYAQHALRSEPWAFVQYDAQVAAYRSAIEAAAPGIALAGPDTSGSGAFETWGLGEVVAQHPALLTGHHYPLGCAEQPAPSIARLLSAQVRLREQASLANYMAIAQAGETPFRLDEANTVSCGGVPGISNTFASALWAVGFLTSAMRTGVTGVNLHGNPDYCAGYAPVCAPTAEAQADGALVAQPEWYALLLARALIGDRPLAARVSAPAGANLEVAAFRGAQGGLQFVLLDDEPNGSRPIAVQLRVGREFAGAGILALSAPTQASLSGVTLGGRAVAPDGSWSAPAQLPQAPSRDGVITVVIAPGSAMLLSVPSRHG